jgi:hypothetical protein
MTETLGSPDHLGLWLQRAGGFLARAGFGFFVLIAAFAALLATTVIGLAIAIAALFLTFARRSRRSEPSDTLEARETADGWVIEPGSYSHR